MQPGIRLARKFISSSALFGAVGMALAIAAIASPARAVTYVQTSDDCTGLCGTSTSNKIDVTGTATTTDIKLTLASGFGLVDTGANGSGGSFNFGVTSAATYLFTAVAPPSFTNNGIQVQGGTNGTSTSVGSTSISAPGKFSFTNGFALSNVAGNGSNQPFAGPLEFTLNVGLATFLASLATSNGSTFFLDVVGSTGNTGLIDFTLSTVSQVPLPGAALLFGSGLLGLGLLGRRRKQTQLAA